MADGSDIEVTTRGRDSTATSRQRSTFGFENPVMVAVYVLLAVALAVFYSTQIGYQVEKPAWACNWALLIFANIALSIFVLRVSDSVENKKTEASISAKGIFIISLGVVITVGLYSCIELFVVLKPVIPPIFHGDWSKGITFDTLPEQAAKQNNVIRLLAMWIYNHLHGYSGACANLAVRFDADGKSWGCLQDKGHYRDFLWWYVPALLILLVATVASAVGMAILAHTESEGGKKSLSRIGDAEGQPADAAFIARMRQTLTDKQAELVKLRQTFDADASARKTVEGQIDDLRTQLSVLEADLSCVETAAAEMTRIKAQADALEQKLAPCIAGLSAATAAIFQDVMKVFARARQDLSLAPQGLMGHATALRKKIDDAKAAIAAKGVPGTGNDLAARIARLEGEIEALTTWLKAVDAQVKPTLKRVDFDEHGQVVIPGLLMSGRYQFSEAEGPQTHPGLLLFFTAVLLTVNNFAIAPEISPAINPGVGYLAANLAAFGALGVLTYFVLKLFRRRDAGAPLPWLSWLVTVIALVLTAILAWIISQMAPTTITLPQQKPVVTPPPVIALQPMTVSCDMGTNLAGQVTDGGTADNKAGDKRHTTVAWTYGSAEQIDLVEASPSQCRIDLAGDPKPKYAIAVGIASQEGQGDQFKLAARRASKLADVFHTQHPDAGLYLLVVAKHNQDGHDLAPTRYADAKLVTRDQRQAVLLGGNVDAETSDPAKLFGLAGTQFGSNLKLSEYAMQCFYRRNGKNWVKIDPACQDVPQ